MRARRFAGATAARARFAGLLCAVAGAAGLLLSGGTSAVAAPTGIPTLQTKASPSVSLGGSLSDSAQMIGLPGGTGGIGSPPTGTLVFNLYGPSDTTCTAAPVYSSGATLAVQGGVVSTAASGSYTPTATPGGAGSGTYHWIAVYSGDSNYKPTSGGCGDEPVVVTDVTPKLTTVATPPSIQAGSGPVTDTASLTGGKTPTGSITFLLFPPTDPTCTGKTVDVKSVIPVPADPSSIVSDPFTPTVAGTYHWIAVYSGDPHNGASNGKCGDPNETLVVTPGPAQTTGPGAPGGTPGSTTPTGPCDPVATAKAVLSGIAATLTGQGSTTFRNSCSAGVRIVLRAKEIRPGNTGTPYHNGFTTMANVLTHISPSGPSLTFSLNAAGLALRSYALGHTESLTAFLIVHIRPDKTTKSTESLQILTLG